MEQSKQKRRAVSDREVNRFLDAWMAVRQYIQAANFNRFQGAGLSATQFMTLNVLPSNGEGMAMGELARRLNLKPATVAQTVDSLEARKLVERERGVTDKRVVSVKVTGAGVEFQNAAQSGFRSQIEALFRAMLPEERAGLIVGLESFQRAAGHAGDSPKSGSRDEAPPGRNSRVAPGP